MDQEDPGSVEPVPAPRVPAAEGSQGGVDLGILLSPALDGSAQREQRQPGGGETEMRALPGLCLALIGTACATGPQKMPSAASPPAATPRSDRSDEEGPARDAFQRGYEAAQKGEL